MLFVGYTFWHFAWRWVAPAFEKSGYILERTVWYLAGFWVGVLMNVGPGLVSVCVRSYRV